MTQKDNWGWQARIGMFIVGSEAVPEAEWWAMMPPHVSVHAARVTARAPWAAWREDRSGVDLAEDVVRGARQFATMQLNAVVIGHSSSSIMGGSGWDEAVIDSLSEILGPNVAVTTNGLDCAAGLAASGVKRPFIVFPAWFGEKTVAAGLHYFTERGLAPAGHLRFDPGRNWRDVAPSDMYPQGLGFAQEIEPLYNQIRTTCPTDADGVLIAGTGFRCVAIIDALERDLKRPVVTANQVSLWRCLRMAGIHAHIEHYGSLFGLQA
jgi:maleate isomerase